MPATKVIKPKPAGTPGKTQTGPKPVKVTVVTGERAKEPRKGRASSCPRGPQRATGGGGRARSASTAPTETHNRARTNRDHRGTLHAPNRGPREQRTETKTGSQSHKAFTVIPPNPKKRREIQRKAEAELAALEELRLSRAMAYVSINPSSVGGCMSLQEVRLKQQQEMMQAKRRPMKTQVMEQTPVVRC